VTNIKGAGEGREEEEDERDNMAYVMLFIYSNSDRNVSITVSKRAR
jgi:hypothetical protein